MGFQSTTKTGLDTYKNGYIYTYKPWQPNTMDIVSSLQYWARVLQQKGCMLFNHYHIGILSQHIVEYPPMIGTPRWIDLIWSNTAFRCRFIHQNHGSFSLRSKENWENTRLHWAHRKPGDHHPIHDWNERPTEKSHGRNRKKHMAFLLW